MKIRHRKIALMLALRQQVCGMPSTDIAKVDAILFDPLIVIDQFLSAMDRSNGNFYVFPEVNMDFAPFQCTTATSSAICY